MACTTASNVAALAPLATALPDPPAEGAFTSKQWTTLMSIMDTVVPSIVRDDAADKLSQKAISYAQYDKTIAHLEDVVVDAPSGDALDKYLADKPSDDPHFEELLKRMLVEYSRDDARKGLTFILSALNSRVGSKFLTGHATPIHKQPIHIREAVLERWRLSHLPPLNGLYKQLTVAAKNIWLKTSTTFPEAAGYSHTPVPYKQGEHIKHDFLQFPAGQGPEVIETDVVIVGSGCGGGVCAKNLAEAGHRVLVVEKGYHYPPTVLPMTEEACNINLLDNGGTTFTDDGSVAIISGSTWGGGGTVNWSASLQTQGYVRKEWAQDRGLTFFETSEFQTCLDRVCHRMGVSADNIRHNHRNLALLDGSRKLGYAAKPVPQNTGGHEHYCGSCSLGCSAAEKQGPAVSWLPDAAAAGAQFVEGFQVDRVLFEESKGRKKAVGVKGKWTSRNSRGGVDGPITERTVREVIVKAKKVIVSGGTLWSPIVLLNSGLKNRHIGRHTYLHPVNFVAGVYKEDVRPWEGGILTSVCSSFENLDGHGHGVKLEAVAMPPSIISLGNCFTGLKFKEQALKYRHTNLYISLARDRDTGRVYPDAASGVPRVDYTPSTFDGNHILEGMIALAKICYVTGATEIHAGVTGMPAFIRNPADGSAAAVPAFDDPNLDPGITDPRFATWLKKLCRIGNRPPFATYACAHQMGSNRMSTRERDGVVDPQGRVWGTEGLYVSDASVFPSASGVNPMITNMAISDWISRGVSKELLSADQGTGPRR